jgi:hypothetical protein
MIYVTAVNLALYHPTWQISTYVENNRNCTSSLSADGNKDWFFKNGSCSHTLNNATPWWVVDIGHEKTRITGVNLTNRGDDDASGSYY